MARRTKVVEGELLPRLPRAKTARGTEIEVERHVGCGLLLVKKVGDDVHGVCHTSAVKGVTEDDQQQIDRMITDEGIEEDRTET